MSEDDKDVTEGPADDEPALLAEASDSGESPLLDESGKDEPTSVPDDPVLAPDDPTSATDDPIPAWVEADGAGAPLRAAQRGYLWLRGVRQAQPVVYGLAQLLVTLSLTVGAMGLHWWLNVPEHITESPHDQGSKKKKKKKPKRGKKKPRPAKKATQPRTAEELEADWAKFEGTSFEDEPTRAMWARRHQAIINRAVVLARREAFEGAPEQLRVVLSDTRCRTVRCRFTLRSQYPHAIDSVIGALSRLELAEQGVWRSFEREPLPPEEGRDEHFVQMTVAFETDESDSRTLTIAPAEGEGEESGGEAGAEPEPSKDGAGAGEAGAGKAGAGEAEGKSEPAEPSGPVPG